MHRPATPKLLMQKLLCVHGTNHISCWMQIKAKMVYEWACEQDLASLSTLNLAHSLIRIFFRISLKWTVLKTEADHR